MAEANTLKEEIKGYLEGQTFAEIDGYLDAASQFAVNSNEAFSELRPESIGQVLLAAHDEPSELVERTLGILDTRYRQPGSPRFGLVISCNAPHSEITSQLYKKNVQVIESFLRNSSSASLPVAYAEFGYGEEATQGLRRRHLAGAVIAHTWETCEEQDDFPDDISLLHLDVDTLDLSDNFISGLHNNIMRGNPNASSGVRHFRDSRFPQLNRALALIDAANEIDPTIAWDGYGALSMRAILRAGNFNPEINISEVHNLIAGIPPSEDTPDDKTEKVFAVSHPRRLHEKFLKGASRLDVCWWSFDAHEQYRTHPPEVDISEEQSVNIQARALGDLCTSVFRRLTDHLADTEGLSEESAKLKAWTKIVDIVRQTKEEYGTVVSISSRREISIFTDSPRSGFKS